MRVRSERGAAAVEFALVLIPLLVLLLGIIEFGYVFNQQLTVTNAAREGARVLAITRDTGDATTAALNAAASLQSTPAISTSSCPATGSGDAEVEVTIELTTITGIEAFVPAMGSIELTGKGVMPCGG
ncbi:pilus assembly protein [Agromyces luteolus]|uniref:Pilus assembly protein n=1 Tax=Agromyces luteolus TaxID=88373 RepID=A0A7C9HL44_9MICO|nr:pilus assembly protein [Agromyces luteolus]